MDSSTAFELAGTDALGQAALAAAGEVCAAELLEAAILRLEAGRDLNAVIVDLFERGRAQAAALDTVGVLRDGSAGPLAGVPFLLKDLGASLAGTPEPSLFGPTANPWSPTITPGASSGGSAAAVAPGIVPAASGGDGRAFGIPSAAGSLRLAITQGGLKRIRPPRYVGMGGFSVWSKRRAATCSAPARFLGRCS
ncbi:hypothetical protein JDV09_20735 [Mycobacterium sp. Y57]|uniref:amidase family protein n=1 Tax=Mycolicibacterium xanthum TaxID=2796469 RepID=UPI001C85355A|nr:hypothetical protein [Mycolicibacterium xanthum]